MYSPYILLLEWGLQRAPFFKDVANLEREKYIMAKGKESRKKKVAKVMREGYEGTLHSGSKKGPIVTNPKQMQAIAMSEAGMSRKKK